MDKNPHEIQHLTAADYHAAPFEKVILPLGSLESHGPHLPFGTDALTAYLIALEIAGRVPRTAVLPPVNYGMSEHYKEFPFTVSLQFETEIALLRDILESVYREGIRKVFVMNGHDGNIAPIEVAARTAKVAHPDFKIVSLDAWWKMVGDLVPTGFLRGVERPGSRRRRGNVHLPGALPGAVPAGESRRRGTAPATACGRQVALQ